MQELERRANREWNRNKRRSRDDRDRRREERCVEELERKEEAEMTEVGKKGDMCKSKNQEQTKNGSNCNERISRVDSRRRGKGRMCGRVRTKSKPRKELQQEKE